MTARELMNKHNENKNTVGVALKVCEQFLTRYKDYLTDKTDEQIFDYFENWIYNICFG